MAFIEWNSDMSVGVSELDKHHQKLVKLINDLHSAMSAGKGRELVSSTLDELVQYTLYHFGAEEKLMTEHQYTFYAAHKAEHDKFVKKAGELVAEHKAGNPAITIPVMNFLKEWLNGHIKGTDKRYGPFLNSKGVK